MSLFTRGVSTLIAHSTLRLFLRQICSFSLFSFSRPNLSLLESFVWNSHTDVQNLNSFLCNFVKQHQWVHTFTCHWTWGRPRRPGGWVITSLASTWNNNLSGAWTCELLEPESNMTYRMWTLLRAVRDLISARPPSTPSTSALQINTTLPSLDENESRNPGSKYIFSQNIPATTN